jgi:hypothetical protein
MQKSNYSYAALVVTRFGKGMYMLVGHIHQDRHFREVTVTLTVLELRGHRSAKSIRKTYATRTTSPK